MVRCIPFDTVNIMGARDTNAAKGPGAVLSSHILLMSCKTCDAWTCPQYEMQGKSRLCTATIDVLRVSSNKRTLLSAMAVD